DELHRVGEVRQRQQPGHRTLSGVVDVVEVRQPVGRDVQQLFDVVAVTGQQTGQVGDLLDALDQGGVAFVEELPHVVERLIQRGERAVEVRRTLRQHL